MVSGFDGWLSVGILAVVGVLIYLWVKSQEVRLVEQKGEEAENPELRAKHQKQAQKMLEEAGYRVTGKNRRVRCDLLMRKKVWDGDLIADFTVRKDNEYYVCKVWTNPLDPLPDGVQLRNELLPLQMLYRSSGCLFVDVVNDKIEVLSFGLHDHKGAILKWRNRLTWMTAGIVLALIIR